MMTKERFVYLINFIQEHQTLESNLCNALEAMTDGCYCDALVYSEYENELIQTMKDALNLSESDDIIDYFICDLDFGRSYKPGAISDNNGDIDLSTAEKLYDYIISKK